MARKLGNRIKNKFMDFSSFIIIVIALLWIYNRYFAFRPEKYIEKLWKRIHKLDNEVRKIFEDNKIDTDNLAFGDVKERHTIWELNEEIDITGKLIDALTDYYFPDEDGMRYQSKFGVKFVKENIYKLYVEKENYHWSIQGALKMKNDNLERENKNAESKRKKEIHKELYGKE